MLKKKAFRKGVLIPVLRVIDQTVGSGSFEEQSETAIERKVGSSDEQKEPGPCRADQVGIGQKRIQPTPSFLHVETAISSVEQAQLALLRHDPAKSQIARWVFERLARYFLKILISHSANFRCSKASVIFRQSDANSGS